jgi:hypothetical protein
MKYAMYNNIESVNKIKVKGLPVWLCEIDIGCNKVCKCERLATLDSDSAESCWGECNLDFRKREEWKYSVYD